MGTIKRRATTRWMSESWLKGRNGVAENKAKEKWKEDNFTFVYDIFLCHWNKKQKAKTMKRLDMRGRGRLR